MRGELKSSEISTLVERLSPTVSKEMHSFISGAYQCFVTRFGKRNRDQDEVPDSSFTFQKFSSTRTHGDAHVLHAGT